MHLLGRSKGYRLIGANGPNTNAFFMRDDVGVNDFPAVNVAECLSSDYAKHQRATHRPKIKGLTCVGVTETGLFRPRRHVLMSRNRHPARWGTEGR